MTEYYTLVHRDLTMNVDFWPFWWGRIWPPWTKLYSHQCILNLRFGFLANPFLQTPFPFLPDWFHRLLHHLMFFC